MSTTSQKESLFGSALSAYHSGRKRGDSMGLVGVISKARFSNVRVPTGGTGVQDKYSNTLRTNEGETLYNWPFIDEDMTSTLTPEQLAMFAIEDAKKIEDKEERKKRLKAIAASLGTGAKG